MQNLILYATKSGAAKECAHLLAAKLTECSIRDIAGPIPHLENYDTVIIGSGVRMGKLYKPVRIFLRKNSSILLSKKFAFYFCNAYPDTLQKAIDKSVPQELINHAICTVSFGGKPPFTSPKNQDWIKLDQVATFAQAIS